MSIDRTTWTTIADTFTARFPEATAAHSDAPFTPADHSGNLSEDLFDAEGDDTAKRWTIIAQYCTVSLFSNGNITLRNEFASHGEGHIQADEIAGMINAAADDIEAKLSIIK